MNNYPINTTPKKPRNMKNLSLDLSSQGSPPMPSSKENDLPQSPSIQGNLNAYENGPICVLEPNLFLFSEPETNDLRDYNVIINVAKEITPNLMAVPSPQRPEYYSLPWTHTSSLCPDLPYVCETIDYALQQNKKVLVHCQCGVSRSASVIVAYFMWKFHWTLNDAYKEVKTRAPSISPNMTLIFQLVEWGEQLFGCQSINLSPPEMITTP